MIWGNLPQRYRGKTKKVMQVLLMERFVRLVRYWVMLTRFFHPHPPAPSPIKREGELSFAEFVIIC